MREAININMLTLESSMYDHLFKMTWWDINGDYQ